jgi:hypothetical protein
MAPFGSGESNQLMIYLKRSEGGATTKEPTGGWDDARVQVCFDSQASFSARTPTRSLPTQTPSRTPRPTPTPPPKPAKNVNIGAIVGGVIGGVAALALTIFALWCCLRGQRRRRRQQAAASAPAELTTATSPTHAFDSEQKYSVIDSDRSMSTVGPQVQSFTHSSPYTTPRPMQPNYSSYHPAHGPRPMTYYPPPSEAGSRPDTTRAISQEMPTLRSPEAADTNIIQPVALGPDISP